MSLYINKNFENNSNREKKLFNKKTKWINHSML